MLDWCGSAPTYQVYYVALFSGACDLFDGPYSPPNSTDCGDGNPSVTYFGMAAGTYYVIIADVDGSAGTYNIVVNASACAPPPANDEACDVVPQALAVDGSVSASGTLNGATDSEGMGVNTVWEAFTLTECADVTFDWCGSADPLQWAYAFLVFGDCAAIDPNEIPLISGASCGEAESLLRMVYALAPGTYYVLAYAPLGSAPEYAVEISAATCAPPPTNDNCANVVPEVLEVGTPLTFTGTLIAATLEGDFVPGPGLEGQNTPTVWHAFTTTGCSTVRVSYCDIDPAFGQTWVFLVTNCPSDNTDIVFGSWEVGSCNDGNVTITYWDLPGGTYYLPVGNFGYHRPYTVEVTASACGPICAAWANSGYVFYEKIASVEFAGINNNSFTGEGYEDFTNVEGDALAGQSYPITVSLINGYALDQVLVWLDADLSDSFSPDELLYTSPLGAGPFTGNVTIPADALAGPARLRVRMHDTNPANGPNAEPCGGASYGQVEDYTVNITNTTGLNERSVARPSVYPNPSNGDFTLQLDPRATQANITVIDPAGRIVLQHTVRNMSNGLVRLNAMGFLEPGPYIVRADDGRVVSDHQLVVQQ